MDWPTTAIGSVSIIAGIASFTKIVTTKRNNKNYKSYQGVVECNRRHDALDNNIKDIKDSVVDIKEHIAHIEGWLEKDGKT